VRRVEDLDLVTGASTYVGNLRLDGMLHLAFVRSPLAHGTITAIGCGEAAAAAGVVAVFTAADLDLPAHHGLMVVNPDLPRPPLATDRVRFVGEAVAVVVAETKAQAVDAAELVEVDYDPLPVVVDPEDALDPASEPQFAGRNNLAAGARSDEDVLSNAEVVVRARMVNQRLAVMPLEGNAIAVLPGGYEGGADVLSPAEARDSAADVLSPAEARDSAADVLSPAEARDSAAHDLTIWVSTQMPHGFRSQAATLFGLDADRVRVIAPHVGGGFGGKAGMIAEHTVAVGVARRLGRPASWVETRSENLVSMPHGRGQVAYYELGLTREGRITGLRARVVGDAGAYAGFGGALSMGPTYVMSQGVYDIPKIAFDVAVALTNTTPMGAFRGAGRPEATAHLERIMDIAADELGIDPVELRRRNLLDPASFPFTTAPGARYDVGDYDLPLREALRIVDYDTLREEQRTRREAQDPVQLGIGLCVYVEITAGGGGSEYGSVTVHADGSATISAGTSAHGQGHATAFAMLAGDRLGIPMESIRFVQSDTAVVPRGGGTGGSRSLQMGGNAVVMAADDVLDRAKRRAADLLEAAVSDVELTDAGDFRVVGVPTTALSWSQVAGAGEELSAGLDFRQEGATFPFGAHVSVVEVDTETGRVTPRRHVAVDDCGRILNPLLVEGQQHGGLAQGVAQALFEEILFDDDGQPVTSTLADYRMPSAADLTWFETYNTETPTPMNPLGAKGIGESATVGATPAVQNAVVDALRPFGVRHVDLPCTPEKVWRAIHSPLPLWREPPAVFASLPLRNGVSDAASGGEI
jgi:carbon-monoxide dehydrogenase large subunit